MQLTALDVHYPALSDVQAPVPAWAALSSLTALRSLHTSSGLGWTAGALAGVAAAAPCLRQVALTDNHGAVTDEWVQVGTALRHACLVPVVRGRRVKVVRGCMQEASQQCFLWGQRGAHRPVFYVHHVLRPA